MTLSEEQLERIRANRERALEIRRRKQQIMEVSAAECKITDTTQNETCPSQNEINNKKISVSNEDSAYQISSSATNRPEKTSDDTAVELEDFEIGASPCVTKQEAMKMYCLPMGTLEVCDFVEKPNPRNQRFSSMKLYNRSEIRRRARERFGGLEGLVQERKKREKKRFERDYEDVNGIFQTDRKREKKS